MPEEGGLVRHVGEGLDCDGGIEGVVGILVREPVAVVNNEVAATGGWCAACDLDLMGGEGEAGHLGPGGFRDPTSVCPVPAADIDEALPGVDIKRGDSEFEEAGGGLLGGGVVGGIAPHSVMQMVAPEVAVKESQLVVVAGDVGLVRW